MPHRKYYTLATLDDGVWSPQFGDYDRDAVLEERCNEYEGQRVKIISTGDAQADIDTGIAALNAPPADPIADLIKAAQKIADKIDKNSGSPVFSAGEHERFNSAIAAARNG
jgi:hypothetical protein